MRDFSSFTRADLEKEIDALDYKIEQETWKVKSALSEEYKQYLWASSIDELRKDANPALYFCIQIAKVLVFIAIFVALLGLIFAS